MTLAERPPAIAASLVALVALALVSSACGAASGMFDMDEMHQQMHGAGSREPQTPVVPDAAQVTVGIRDFDFFPRELTVDVGTEVTWANSDTVPHDATDRDGGWSTGLLNQGESATLTFDSPGDYEYVCTLHPNMKATLTVSASAAPAAPASNG